MLKSLSKNQPLRECEVRCASHITIGDKGEHVCRVQQALRSLDSAEIDAGELQSSAYGPSTADAVLNYKRRRNIINRTYQKDADNIAGKMTVSSLNLGILDLENRTSGSVSIGFHKPLRSQM